MEGMILAAGYGKRLEPLTKTIPKPAVPVLNVPMLYYAFELIKPLGISNLVINTHHLPQQIEQIAQKIGDGAHQLHFSNETPQPLGSGGGIKKAEPFLGKESFVVINGDFIGVPEEKDLILMLRDYHLSKAPLSTCLVIEDPRVGTEFNGLWVNEHNELQEVCKQPKQKGLMGYHFTGVQFFSNRIFKYLPDGESNIFQDALLPAIQKGEKVLVYPIRMKWFETGDGANYLTATRQLMEIMNTQLPPFLQSLFKSHHSPGTELLSINGAEQKMLLKGSGAKISRNAKLSGFICVGDHAVIEADTELENVVVLPNSKVPKGAKIKNTVINGKNI